MSDLPCAECTSEQMCVKCKEAEQQASEIANTVDTLKPELQTIAVGIVMGLQQITENNADEVALFISKVKIHATANPEIKTFLESILKSYLTAWEFELVTRCLNSLNS